MILTAEPYPRVTVTVHVIELPLTEPTIYSSADEANEGDVEELRRVGPVLSSCMRGPRCRMIVRGTPHTSA